MKDFRLPVAASLLLLVGAIACGIPLGGDPEPLPGGVVAPALSAPSEPAGTTDPVGGGTIFLVRDSHVEAVTRTLPSITLSAVVGALLKGANQREVAAGLRSAITEATTLRSADVAGSIAVLDLSAELVEIGGEEQILAVAQLVLTATTVPGVDRVSFLLEGRPVEVPTPGGTLSGEPLSAADYAPMRTPG
jgi:hypothetical protein